MKEPTGLLRELLLDESGATATEYLILLILIACFVIGIVKVFGDVVKHKYADATNAIERDVTF